MITSDEINSILGFAQMVAILDFADNPKLVLGSHSPSELKCINDLIVKEIFKKLEIQATLGTKPNISLPVCA